MTAPTPIPGSAPTGRRAHAPPHRRLDLIAAVGAGGTVGTFVRYEMGVALPTSTGGFPWSIFAVNVVGALILGLITTLVLERWPPTRYVRPLVGIGFCGGLTTFSTWMVDTTQLVDTHHTMTAVIYVAATLAAGFAALYVGVVGARIFAREGARP